MSNLKQWWLYCSVFNYVKGVKLYSPLTTVISFVSILCLSNPCDFFFKSLKITRSDIKNLPVSLYSKVRLNSKTLALCFCFLSRAPFSRRLLRTFAHRSPLQLLSRHASCPSNEVGGFEHEQPLFCICTTGCKSCVAENSSNSAWQHDRKCGGPNRPHNHSQESDPSIVCLFKWHGIQSEVNKVFIDLFQRVICFAVFHDSGYN